LVFVNLICELLNSPWMGWLAMHLIMTLTLTRSTVHPHFINKIPPTADFSHHSWIEQHP